MSAVWCSAYVGIGSNLGEPVSRVIEAFDRLGDWDAVRCLRRSSLYRSAPMGPQAQPPFVNAAAGFVTMLGPRELLEGLLRIERVMGRERSQRWGPRIIDLDLLWMAGASIDEPGLTVPHPGVSTRNFVLYPLVDIAPGLRIPGLGDVRGLLRDAGAEGISVLQ